MEIRDGEEMPLKHKLYMPPLKKYKIYGKYPWPLTISVLLAFLTSLQVMLVVTTSTNYSYEQITLWNNIFLNRDVDGDDTSLTNSYHLFNLEKLKTYIGETIERYININDYTLDHYKHTDLENNKPVLYMYINYLNPSKAQVMYIQSIGLSTKYVLDKGNMGPFDHYNPKKFIDIVDSFMLEFSLKHHLNENVPTSSNCYKWKIYQLYSYTMHGPITVSLDFKRGVCDIGYVDMNSKYYWLNVFILILGISELVFTSLHIYTRASLVSRIQNNRHSSTVVWDNLGFEEKTKFIDMWIIFTTIGNVCQILGSLNIVLIGDVTLSVNEVVIGIGCFCSWISVIHYLKPSHNSYMVIDTLSRAYFRLGPFIYGVLPIFIGFVFLAMCLFWKTGNYPSVTSAIVVLYSMVNGDTLYPFMSQNIQVSGFFGQLYCYAYLLFFISVVQNIFIAIITDGFQSLKTNPVDKTGSEIDKDDSGGYLYQFQTTSPKNSEKLLARQKSKNVFSKLLKNSEKQQKDKTPKYLEKLESLYKNVCRNIDKLALLREVKEAGVDADRIREKVNLFLQVELPELVDSIVSL